MLPEATPTSAIPLAQSPLQKINEYFSSQTITYSDGTILKRSIISGPPVPPPGYELERSAVSLPESDEALGTRTLVAPAFSWFFGCAATSGAMIAGYYDRNGYPNMYTGPTNGWTQHTWGDAIGDYMSAA